MEEKEDKIENVTEEQIEEKENEKVKKPKKCSTILIWYILAVIIISAVIVILGIIVRAREEKRQQSYTTLEPYYEKPIIYLYPEEKTEVTVKLGRMENLLYTYPKYKETGWNVTAYPDGTLVDNETGRELYSLYWEGLTTENITISEGFVVKGEDTIKFLEEKLSILGLSQREAEEFIIYWLPKLESNKYNLIRFATREEIDDIMPLELSKEPDTIIRILMEYKAMDKYIEIPEQELETPERTGFVAVEWGGTEIH